MFSGFLTHAYLRGRENDFSVILLGDDALFRLSSAGLVTKPINNKSVRIRKLKYWAEESVEDPTQALALEQHRLCAKNFSG